MEDRSLICHRDELLVSRVGLFSWLGRRPLGSGYWL